VMKFRTDVLAHSLKGTWAKEFQRRLVAYGMRLQETVNSSNMRNLAIFIKGNHVSCCDQMSFELFRADSSSSIPGSLHFSSRSEDGYLR